uniref:Uncharacterized protein n=1 Tax=Candidatus Kentrum sp. LPFa TaxID=2126335 RepID=A0A450WN08_9GAMM|nr:MAG: hypothetical protein BECKLPF1236B_GA0070989_11411 [Candidatus Kentron sp. LPFa]
MIKKSENLKNVVFHRSFWLRIFRVGNIEPMVYFILIFGFYHVSPWQETAMRETVRFLLMETLRNHEGMGARQAREIPGRAYTCQGRAGNMVRGVASLVVLSKIFPVSDIPVSDK